MKPTEIRRIKLKNWFDGKTIPQKEKSYISQLIHGKAPFGEKAARRLEDTYGMGLAYLDTLTNDVLDEKISAKSLNIVINQYEDVAGSMGRGLILQDQPGEISSIHVSDEWVRKNVKHYTSINNLCIVTGFGDSMRGMYNPGDPLLVDAGVKTIEFDGVYFFRIGDEGFIKTLQRIPGVGIRAISENKKYEAWTITKDMQFEVLARVIKVWESTDF